MSPSRLADLFAGRSKPRSSKRKHRRWSSQFETLERRIVPAIDPVINEIKVSPDSNEYVEILGEANTIYADYYLVQVEGNYFDSDRGRITDVFHLANGFVANGVPGATDAPTNPGETDANGLIWTGFRSGVYDNDSTTLLLVHAPGPNTPDVNEVVDSDFDGRIDTVHWDTIVDAVAVVNEAPDSEGDTYIGLANPNAKGGSCLRRTWIPRRNW